LANILDKIIADKRHEVRSRKEKTSLEELKEQARTMPKCQNFYKAITKPNRQGINVIADQNRKGCWWLDLLE
jgi:indole-3-glycerol phosphate synthase